MTKARTIHLRWLAPLLLSAVIAAPALAVPATFAEKQALASPANPVPDLAVFLDRLMHAESGGRDAAANPRSTALGAYQFIKSTFIDIARRRFAREVEHLTDEEILALRMHRSFARAAATIYTLENAAHLKGEGITPTLPHLRIAYLLGPVGAARVLQATPGSRLSALLSQAVIQANPFMVGMTSSGLLARATREMLGKEAGARVAVVGADPQAKSAARARAAAPAIVVACNEKLASCQRWIALQTQKQLKIRNAQGGTDKRKKPGIPVSKLPGAGA